jgi:hypothetical protein
MARGPRWRTRAITSPFTTWTSFPSTPSSLTLFQPTRFTFPRHGFTPITTTRPSSGAVYSLRISGAPVRALSFPSLLVRALRVLAGVCVWGGEGNRGIMLLANPHFRLLNGLSTTFWGWGRVSERERRHCSLRAASLLIRPPSPCRKMMSSTSASLRQALRSGSRGEARLCRCSRPHPLRVVPQVDRPPEDIGTDTTNTFIHLHDDERRPRDMMKVGGTPARYAGRRWVLTGWLSRSQVGDQFVAGKQRDMTTGVSTVAVRRLAWSLQPHAPLPFPASHAHTCGPLCYWCVCAMVCMRWCVCAMVCV